MHEQQELVPDVSHETIILIRPTQETITQEHFSIGTQFVRRTPRDTDDVYGIQFVTQECPVYSSIAKTNAIPFKVRTAAQGRTLFVAFINSLINDADNAHGVIPFTCGGSSLQHYYANVPALSHDIVVPDPKTKENVTVKLWNRIEQYKPASGLDAAEFILRACSLCGIPFPFKTTSMMRKFLKPITHEDLEDGDFFWTPGGLVTISSLNDNQIVAASGYTYGHGQIIRCKLNELFKGVENFAQLLRAYHERQPLEILDKSGAVYKKITEYALLKFNSIDQAIEEFRKQRNSNSNAN
jgi:hypothetical protein